MQTFITDMLVLVSAQNLDRKRLGSQIYEGIHILASLLSVPDKLVTPKRDVSNHPASKLWASYENELFFYVKVHLSEWYARGYASNINAQNLAMLSERVQQDAYFKWPSWVSSATIEVHRSSLITKNSEHYQPLWPSTPPDLLMRYDWKLV